jgi:hypothetical protein
MKYRGARPEATFLGFPAGRERARKHRADSVTWSVRARRTAVPPYIVVP